MPYYAVRVGAGRSEVNTETIFGVLWNSTAAWAVREGEGECMEEVWERRKLVKGRKGSHKTLFPP